MFVGSNVHLRAHTGRVRPLTAGVCEKTLLQRRRRVGNSLKKHNIGGWIAVSATGLQGKGLRERSVFFTDAGSWALGAVAGPPRCTPL